jgi:hypothetical protein
MSWKGGLTLLERGTRDRAAGEVGARWRVISAAMAVRQAGDFVRGPALARADHFRRGALASIEEGLSLRLRAVRTVIALDLLHSRDAVGLGLGPPRGSRDFDGDRSEQGGLVRTNDRRPRDQARKLEGTRPRASRAQHHRCISVPLGSGTGSQSQSPPGQPHRQVKEPLCRLLAAQKPWWEPGTARMADDGGRGSVDVRRKKSSRQPLDG